MYNGEVDIKESNDLSEALKELNSDKVNETTGMSDIDLRTRLSMIELPSILQIDLLVSLGVLPAECLSLTSQKKRLNVSLYGRGRTEILKIAIGKNENAEQSGVTSGSLASRFGKKK